MIQHREGTQKPELEIRKENVFHLIYMIHPSVRYAVPHHAAVQGNKAVHIFVVGLFP